MPAQHINVKNPAAPREPSALKGAPEPPSRYVISGFTFNLPPLSSAYSSTSLRVANTNAAKINNVIETTCSLNKHMQLVT